MADGLMGYEPLPEVVGWLESKAKIRVLRGGNRSSKTQTAAFEFARWARGLQISKKYQKLPRPRRGKLELLCVAIDYNKIGEVNYAKLFLPGQYFKYRFKCPQCGELVFASAERCAEAEWMTMIRNNAKTRFAAYDGMVHCWTCGFMMKLAEVPPEWRWEAPPLIPEREIVKMSWADKAKNIPAFVETTTARISFLSGQSGREHFQGNRWHMVWIDEELGDDSGGVWSEIIRGTMDLSGRILWSATPLARQDALIDIHDKAVAKDPDIYEAVVGLVHNHHIALKERASVARSWPREQWMCRIKGEFFALEGLVYPEFQRDIHCVPRWNIAEPSNAKDFTWYRSIDPGLGVTACLWFGVDRYGDYIITDELFMESGNIKTMVDLIREIDAGRYICDTTIDPSDQRSLTCREGLRVVLARDYGMPCHSNFSRDVNQGIFRCKEDLIVNSERKRPRMTVFEDCENFIREMTRYRRGDKKDTADNSNKVVKRDDHACFPAGQLVDTPSGPVPIENVRPGDIIVSHDGTAVVEHCGRTGVKPVFRVSFDDGRDILCTGEHPLAIADGWVRAEDALGTEVVACLPPSELSLRGESTADTPGANWTATATTSSGPTAARRSTCIAPSGSIITAPSRPPQLCITSTATPPTTPSRTSAWSRRPPIAGDTRCLKKERRRHAKDCGGSTPWPSRGMEARTASPGTRSTDAKHTPVASPENTPADTAARSTRASLTATPASAPTTARARGVGLRASITRLASARVAAARSQSTATRRRNTAPGSAPGLRVVSVRKESSQQVYSISTTSGTCLINGVLASNCDAFRYRVVAGLQYRGGIASEGIYYPTAAMKVWAEEELPRIRSERKAQEAML